MGAKGCPACGLEVPDGTSECPYCGVIFDKWRGRPERPPRPPSTPPPALDPPPRPATAPPAGRRPSGRRALGLAVVGLAVVVGVAWWQEVGPFGTRPGSWRDPARPIRGDQVRLTEDPVSDFDRWGQLPAGPKGLTWAGSDLLVGSRDDPWGFLRLSPGEEGAFRLVTVPVIEPVYQQTVEFQAVTWNGQQVVAYTDGAWFEENDHQVFTVHDPETLQVVAHYPAPPLLGCLAWDGHGYWAATRRNTRDSGEPAFLYRLSPTFQVLDRMEPPGFGCQGMAWDGELLWLVDVFDESITVLDPASSPPRLVQRYVTRFDYLSGIAFDGADVWVSEYGEDRLYRLNPRLAEAWRQPGSGREVWAAGRRRAEAGPAVPEGSGEGGADAAELRRKLRSDDWADRMEAEMELRRRGLAVDYDRDQNQFPDPEGPEVMEIYDWAVEMRENALYGSWHLYFGEGLFPAAEREQTGLVRLPLFVRYTVTVEGGSLSSPIEREYDAEPRDNRQSEVKLASGLGPGTYQVSLFLHVQYVKPDGEGQILNRSAVTLEVGR